MSLVEAVFTISVYEKKYKSIDYEYLGNIYNNCSVLNALSAYKSTIRLYTAL